jgi:hypothetical protein
VAAPKESEPPPLIPTGELEKKLKESIDNLQKVLPQIPGGEESAAPPPVPPLPQEPKGGTEKNIVLPPMPPGKNDSPTVTPSTNPVAVPPKVDPPMNVSPAGSALPNLPSPPPMALESDTRNPAVTIPPPKGFQPIEGAATISSQDDFQKRLVEVEMKYLKEMIGELERRMQPMPMGEERRKVAMDHQRYSDRLARMMKATDMIMDRHIAQTGAKQPMTDSPWTLHLETTDGKTVLQAVVHRKAKFKVVCDRLDLQSPRGAMMAVGHVQLSGEGFQGACDRLSIPLHDDRLILEGNAEVGIRTQPTAIIEERREGVPPLLESRRVDEQASSAVPILHLKGDHLDLRWSDLQPTAPANTRADPDVEKTGTTEVPLPTIKGTAGPMVKVAFNSAANEKWSEWGTLLALPVAPGEKNAPRQYAIQNRDGQILAFVRAPASMSLEEYLGKRVSVFGVPAREDGRTVMTYAASHVAWE